MKSAQIVVLLVWGLLPSGPNQRHEQQEPAAYQSDSYPDSQSAANTNQDCGRRTEQKEKESDWITRSAVATAAFTLALVVATILLWWGGERHSERELRAYVFVRGVDTNYFPGPTEAILDICNFGKTPAYDFEMRVTFEFHQIPRTEFDHYRNESPNPSRGTLGPGAGIDVIFASPKPLTSGHVQAMQDGKFALFIFGTLNYRDAFKKPRVTNIRYIGTLDRKGSIAWDVMDAGNEST